MSNNPALGKFQPTLSHEDIVSRTVFFQTTYTARQLLEICRRGEPFNQEFASDLATELLECISVREFAQTPEYFLDVAIKYRAELTNAKPVAMKFIAKLTGIDIPGGEQ